MKKQSERKEIRKGHTIYFRKSGGYIPVSEEVFKNHYRTVDTFRHRMQYHGECCCPKDKRLQCDTDCAGCPFQVSGENLSLDEVIWEENEDEVSWIERKMNSCPSPEDFFCDKEEIRSILSRIEELMPEAIEIGKMRLKGLSTSASMERVGISRSTYYNLFQILRGIIEREFPDYF